MLDRPALLLALIRALQKRNGDSLVSLVILRRPDNTGDKLRSSIACAGFVCFIPLFDGTVF